MIVKNAQGREIEIDGISGPSDDIQIEACYYVDTPEHHEVDQDDIDYILDRYAAELEESWVQQCVCLAESTFEDR